MGSAWPGWLARLRSIMNQEPLTNAATVSSSQDQAGSLSVRTPEWLQAASGLSDDFPWLLSRFLSP